jgi:hypothetical protein
MDCRGARLALEEKRNRHLKDLGQVLQAAGANAVRPFLVFLQLLKCQTKRLLPHRFGSSRA